MTTEGFDDENSALISVKNVIRALYCHPDALSLAGTFWILDKTLPPTYSVAKNTPNRITTACHKRLKTTVQTISLSK